jgi:hypothetical protein
MFSFSPTLFDIYRNERIIQCNNIYSHEFEIIGDITFNTILFADDQATVSDSEGDLERPLFTLHNNTKQFRMEISALKSDVTTFRGQFPNV